MTIKIKIVEESGFYRWVAMNKMGRFAQSDCTYITEQGAKAAWKRFVNAVGLGEFIVVKE